MIKQGYRIIGIIGIILLVMVTGLQILGSGGGLKKIDSKRFFQILEKGDIEKVAIVNKEKVEVHIKQDKLSDPMYQDVKSRKSNTRRGRSVPQYCFSIISQDDFIIQLLKEMNALPEDARPTYVTVTRHNYFAMYMLWILPLLLLVLWASLLIRNVYNKRRFVKEVETEESSQKRNNEENHYLK